MENYTDNKRGNNRRNEKRRGRRKNRFQFLTRVFPKSMKKKLLIQFFVVLAAFGILLGRVIYINIVNGEEYEKQVLDQASYDSRTIPFKRGDIVDTNGTTLASSERVYNVILDVRNLLATTETDGKLDKAIEQTTEVLVEVFGISEEDIETAIEEKPNSQYVTLKKNIDYDTSKLFEEYEDDNENYPYLTGVWLEEGYIRSYPYGSLASSVIGYANASNNGTGGVEQYYNSILNGIDGREYGYFYDASTEVTVENAQNGNTVVMTIDQTLQSIVEKHIHEFNDTYENNYTEGEGSANTAVIITNPNTGEILASATYPDYDLNNPADLSEYYTTEELTEMTTEETSTALNSLWSNFVVTSTFEPGSPIKPFTVAAALETGAVDGSETYVCTGGLQVDDYYIGCVNLYGHGELTIEEAISESCNSVLMQIADDIGIVDFTTYQELFGFGQLTGVDLPNETSAASLIYTEETMKAIDLATNSFGQSFNVTMIQMVSAFGALVNGGNYYEPYIVRQIQDSSGNVIENIEPTLVKKIVSESTSETVSTYLRAVVESGTGSYAAVEGYDIGGKTGTAEKLPRGNECYVLSFLGCVPIDEPEIVIYVVIDEPNVEDQSSSIYAQQLAGDILAEALPYLGITTIAESEGESLEVSDVIDEINSDEEDNIEDEAGEGVSGEETEEETQDAVEEAIE